MRNLKRALSLALASVMLLGMMVVGTSAASYPDIDENDNVEAIEVLNAVQVMIGDRGNFRPDAAVNRHEMATIMAKLVLGVETADNYVGSHPFTDVFPWADKYVAACYENGLVAGTSATTFGGNQPLTAVQAAAMMLRALGYKDLSKGANDWRAPVTAMANQIRLFNGVASNPSEQLNRNQVAQLALNTLKSPMVNLKDNTISWTDGEGQVVITGGGREYIALSSNEAYARAINDTEKAGTSASQISGWTVELGEHLYNGKLKLNNNYLDVFGRPSRHWEFDGKEIGSYIKEELMVMDNVGKVTGNDLYTLLGSSTIKDYDTLVTIDGVDNKRSDAKDILGNPGAYFDEADMNRSNKDKVGATGTGVLTQVFVDHEKNEIYVAIINTYLARAARDYDSKAEEATLTVYGIDEYRTSKEYVKAQGLQETMKVQNEDFDLVKDVQKNDPYLVTVADGEIQTMVVDEVLEAVTLTAFKKADHVVSSGTEYAYTTTATYKDGDLDNYTGINGNTNLKDITYNIYLDAYGNLIGIEEIDAVKNYVFLAGIDVDGSNLYSKTATANALFLDGTSKTIKINLAKSEFPAHPELGYTNVVISGNALLNTWCTYTVSGDMYTVKEAYATSANPYSGTTANANNYPQHGDNTTKLAQTWQAMTNTGKVSVKNLRLSGGPTSGAFTNVYGDSTSVYLTAELDELYNDGQSNINGGYSYGIIKGVDSVTTGVADTSIEIWTEAEARREAEGSIKSQQVGHNSYGIYTLYDSDGIVIASVVIGENEGVKDLVYVHSGSLDLESYDSAADIWTWTRKVIFNGEEITLTEKGDGVSDLETMKQYQWYEIKRNAEGNIIASDPAYHALDSFRVDPNYTENEKGYFVDRYEDINYRVEESTKDTVLYQTNGGPYNYTEDPVCHTHKGLDKDLVVIGSNTLAVETLTGSGIHFRNDVNVVLQYWNQNTKQTEVETGTGVDALKSMVNFVNDNNKVRGGDLYWLSAVIEKGFATTVVIYDSYNNYKRPEAGLGTYELTLGGVLNSIYTTPADRNSDVYIVNADGSITYVESNDDIATSTVNGYKRYTVPYGARIRIYDNDTAGSFRPFFSPIKPIYSFYNYYARPTAQRAYIEFTVDERLENDKLTIRERMVTDGIYVGVEKDAKATVTVTKTDGTSKTYKAGESVIVYDAQKLTANLTATDAKLFINGVEQVGATSWTHTVDVTDDYEFIIGTTGGTVTPPDPIEPDEEFTVTIGAGLDATNCEISVGGKVIADGDKIKKGDVLTIKPDMAIAKVTGIDSNGKVTGNVTIEKSPYFNWIAGGNFWMGSDEDGNLLTFPFVKTAQAKARSLARAAASNPIDWPEGTTETMDLETWGALMLDKGATYTISSTFEGKAYTWTATIPEKGGIKWILNKDSSTSLDGARKAAALILSGSATVTKDKAASETPVEPTGSFIKAEVDTQAQTVTITEYVANGAKVDDLTKAEVAAALNDAFSKGALASLNYKFDANGVTFDTTKSTARTTDGNIEYTLKTLDGSKAKVDITTSAQAPKQLYKITYPGGSVYEIMQTSNSVAVTDVTATVDFLLPSTVIAGDSGDGAVNVSALTPPATTRGATLTVGAAPAATNPTTVADGSDITYVAAYKTGNAGNGSVDGLSKTVSGTIVKVDAGTPTATLTPMVVLDPVTGIKSAMGLKDYVQVGTEITFAPYLSGNYWVKDTNIGKTITVKLNTNEVGKFEIVSDGKGGATIDQTKAIKIPASLPTSASGTLAWTCDLSATSDLPVYVDKTLIPVEKDAAGNEFYRIPNMKLNGEGLYLAFAASGNHSGYAGANISVMGTNDRNNTEWLVTKASVQAETRAQDDKGERIDLYRAWGVQGQDAADADLYKAYQGFNDKLGADLALYWPIGDNTEYAFYAVTAPTQYVYIQATDYDASHPVVGATLLAKAGTTQMPGEIVQRVTGAGAGKEAVWKVPVKGNINANTYEVLVRGTGTGVADATGAAVAKGEDFVAGVPYTTGYLTNVTIKNGVDVKVNKITTVATGGTKPVAEKSKLTSVTPRFVYDRANEVYRIVLDIVGDTTVPNSELEAAGTATNAVYEVELILGGEIIQLVQITLEKNS